MYFIMIFFIYQTVNSMMESNLIEVKFENTPYTRRKITPSDLNFITWPTVKFHSFYLRISLTRIFVYFSRGTGILRSYMCES